MSTADQVAKAPVAAMPRVAERPAPEKPRFSDTWWRHLVAIIAVVISLFPVAYIISAAFSANASLTGNTLIPRDLTLHNFSLLLFGSKAVSEQVFASVHYGQWSASEGGEWECSSCS